MRLCVVAGSFHPEVGGPSTYLHRLIPALIQRGHFVTVVTHTGSRSSGLDSSFSYPVYRVTRRWPVPIRMLLFTARVVREARLSDLIFVSDYGLPAALAKLFFRKPIVLKNVSDFAWEFSVRHGWLSPEHTLEEFQCMRHSLRVCMIKWLRTWYVRMADVVIVPSNYISRLVTDWGVSNDRITVIYNALDEGQFASLPDKANARIQCGLPAAAPLVLTVARLVPWKGVAGIIRALSLVQCRFPDVRLLIAGDGPERAELQSLSTSYSDAVQFLGTQSQQSIYKLMSAVDVFVLFSTYEGLPHTVLEAMACGTPVVASAVGGTVEVVSDESTGLLVAPHDIDALGASICRVLREKEFASSLTKRACDELRRFSWAHMFSSTEAILLEVSQ